MAEIGLDKLTVSGIIRKSRKLGGITFLILQSGHELLSLVCRKDILPKDQFRNINLMKVGDYCAFEVAQVNNEKIVEQVTLWHKRSSPEDMLAKSCELICAYDFLIQTLRCFLYDSNYIEVRPPSIHYGVTKAAHFEVNFFNQPARLSSSNSLFLNIYSMRLKKVFSLQRCFRAENSKTNKHLAEFDLLETAMMGEKMEFCISFLESLIKYVVAKFSDSKYSKFVSINIDTVINTKFPTSSYEDVEKDLGLIGKGLGRHERNFAKEIPHFILYYPREFSSWTAKPVSSRFTKSFNLLLPGIGEVAEGNEKMTDVTMLCYKIDKLKLNGQLGWYVNNFIYPNCILSGFGLGVERLAMWLFGLKNIRDIQPFFRDTGFAEIRKV